ncbi:T9SS type B sorting domain-containing protein [uncultured Croceitalea sp.]|uniref:T9SS type B sorting domain-containing protein n=1 Tax=uncultured Croceitalea sp. TaxID=1798908 RepID=UPI003305F382
MSKTINIILVALFACHLSFGQVSFDCAAAIPICSNTPINGGTIGYGNDDFTGAPSSGCLERTTTGAIESNSAWYRFRTAADGQLGFNIGHASAEDWDFALYQATDCNTLGDPVRCNFFDNGDTNTFIGVGKDPTGDVANVQYEDWLNVEAGQDYYLFINNFSANNSGFSIQFSGDIFVTHPFDALDCSIVSNLLGAPIIACENDTITLDATTFDALQYSWYRDVGNGFEQIPGESGPTLAVQNDALYRVRVVTPTESIISDVQVAFSPNATAYPIADEVFCQSQLGFDLSQKNSEVLGGQNPEDFLVTYHSTPQDAYLGIAALPLAYVAGAGMETIYTRVSSAQNPLCFDALQSFQLTTVAPPVLGPDRDIFLCDGETSLTIGEYTMNPAFEYSWSTGETTSSINVSETGTYILTATITVGNVFCVRTRTFEVISSVTPVIEEVVIDGFGVLNTVQIIPAIEGDFEYRIDDNDFQESPIFEEVLPGSHRVYMRDLNGCGVAIEEIAVVGYVAFFSPNGDGHNDEWNIMGLEYLQEPEVTIFDRYGKLVYQFNANTSGWDGTHQGINLPSSDYWFKLTFLDNNGNRVEENYLKKHFSLRR